MHRNKHHEEQSPGRGQDVLETSVNGGPPRIDGIHGRIRRRLMRFQLHHLSWQLQKNIKTKATETRMETFMELILPATAACSNDVGLLLSRIKGLLEDSQMNLQLAVVPNRLGIVVLGRPPFLEEAPGIITIV